MELKTYGDLAKAIQIILAKQKGAKVGQVAVDTIINAIPGLGAAKTTYDFLKAAISKPDSQKSKTWLDSLDLDDQALKIVDDSVENGFIQFVARRIAERNPTDPLEPDFNMNNALIGYLKRTYKGRTLDGISEKTNMKLKQIIQEEIEALSKQPRDVTNLSDRLRANQSLVKLLARINTSEELAQTLTTVLSLVDQTASYNKTKVLSAVRAKLAEIGTSEKIPTSPTLRV